jgi:acylphosphatase
MIERTILTIAGRVQAVGFRETVLAIAAKYAVAGTVRNLRADDRLEIDAEGSESDVAAFLHDVLAHPPGFARVDRVERTTAPPRGVRTFSRAATA